MVIKAKKKPVVIECIQFNGNSNKMEIEKWMGKELKCEVFSDSAYEAEMGAPYFSLFIPTLEGEMRADPHDYIIKGVNGEFYPCKPDIFEKTYSVVNENQFSFDELGIPLAEVGERLLALNENLANYGILLQRAVDVNLEISEIKGKDLVTSITLTASCFSKKNDQTTNS